MNRADGTERSRFEAVNDALRRIPPEAWPFLVVAVLVVIQSRLLFAGFTNLLSWLALGTLVLEALLPAAIFLGRRDAWTTARVVLVGAIVWTTVSAVMPLIVGAEQWLLPGFLGNPDNSPDSFDSIYRSFAGSADDPLNSLIAIERSLAGIASFVGPFLIAIGLERRRRSVTVWPVPLVAVAVVAAIAIGLGQGRTTLDSITASNAFSTAGPSIADLLRVAKAALSPAYLLALGALAWSCLSAVRAGEQPFRFWGTVGTGAALLVGAEIWSIGETLAINTGVMTPDLYMTIGNAGTWLAIAASVAGFGLLLVGFGSGLPHEYPVAEALPLAPEP